MMIDLSTIEARLALEPRDEIYWFRLDKGLHIGYRRRHAEKPGVWVGRYHREQNKDKVSRYDKQNIGSAADYHLADDENYLTYEQAVKRVIDRKPIPPKEKTPTPVRKRRYKVSSETRPVQKNNRSGQPGVYFFASKQKWAARFTYNYKRTFLGLFDTKEEAIAARKEAEEKWKSSLDHQELEKPLTS